MSVMLKPLIPVVADIYEHEFNEIEHLACVHQKYGSHHLQKQLEQSSSNDDHDRNSNTLKSQDEVPFHVLVERLKNASNSPAIDKQFMLSKNSNLLFVP